MLPEVLQQLVREAGGEPLLLDARNQRAILSDAGNVELMCKKLRNGGFTRLIDFTARHHEADEFEMHLVLRHPDHAHCGLSLKWKWQVKKPAGDAPKESYNEDGGAGQPGGHAPRQAGFASHPSLSRVWPAAGLCEREIFEMFGIPFAGNENLAPLLLDERFRDNPLRKDFQPEKAKTYAESLLEQRDEDAMLEAVGGEL